MEVADVITFQLLSKFLNNLRVEFKISIEGNVWIGSGIELDDILTDEYLYKDITLSQQHIIDCVQQYIFVVYPKVSDIDIYLRMSGFDVPVDVYEKIIDNTEYYVIQSKNTYTGTFNITF